MAHAAHWTERYVGLPYDATRFDCAHLVARVLEEQFARRVALPSEHARHYRAQQRQIAAEKGQIASRRAEGELCEDGDGVLLISRGHFDHLGLYARLQGEGWVLHNFSAAGHVCLHRLRDLARHGLQLEGVYRWI